MALDLSKPQNDRTLTKRVEGPPKCFYPDVVVEIILPIQSHNSFEIVGLAQQQMRRAGLATHMIDSMRDDVFASRSQYELVERLERWITVRYWKHSFVEARHVTQDQTPTDDPLTPAERPTPTYRWQVEGDPSGSRTPSGGGSGGRT